LLAPDIVAAILEDALPDGVRLSALLINPPVLWEEQRAQLGTAPAPHRAGRRARIPSRTDARSIIAEEGRIPKQLG
ncbi:hypothetical protein, partial [Lysobacter hankyongensis]|uniref:hypothetical protein n=1 Tax=Lysobacter hankyongensis TaxID=1176535 RepID=UPI003CD07BC9